MPALLAAACLAIAAAATGAAAAPEHHDPRAVDRFSARHPTARVAVHRSTRAASLVVLPPDFARSAGTAEGVDANEAVDEFLAEHADLFGLERTALRGEQPDLIPARAFASAPHGAVNHRWTQHHRGVPVFGGQLGAHFVDGRLRALQSSALPNLARKIVSVKPGLTADAAIEAATAYAAGLDRGPFAGFNVVSTPQASLAILPGFLAKMAGRPMNKVRQTSDNHHLAYEVLVGNFRVFVDAHSGTPLMHISLIQGALDRILFRSALRGPDEAIWTEGDNINDLAIGTEARNVMDGAESIYNMFLVHFGIDGYDQNGSQMAFTIELDDPASGLGKEENCPNAFFTPINVEQLPGAVGGTFFCENFGSETVISHEVGHAYTQYSHGLIYFWMSGGLNEAASDWLGAVSTELQRLFPSEPRVDDECLDPEDTNRRWLVHAPDFGILRDMWKPSCYNDPDSVLDPRFPCSADDQYGVHTTSGVSNHAFALATDGGVFNGVTVPGMGMTKATYAFVYAMLFLQNPLTGFAEHAEAVETACEMLVQSGAPIKDLFDPSINTTMEAADCDSLVQAFIATEMREEPICVLPVFFDSTEGAFTCGNETVLLSETFDAASSTADLVGWTFESLYDPEYARDVSVQDEGAGGKALFFPNINDPCTGDLTVTNGIGSLRATSPEFTIPETGGDVTLTFDQRLQIEPEWEVAFVELVVNGRRIANAGIDNVNRLLPSDFIANGPLFGTTDDSNAALSGLWTFTGYDPFDSPEMFTTSVSLSRFVSAGDTVKVSFVLNTDDCFGVIGWAVDNIRVAQGNVECSEPLPLFDGDETANWRFVNADEHKGGFETVGGEDFFGDFNFVQSVDASPETDHYVITPVLSIAPDAGLPESSRTSQSIDMQILVLNLNPDVDQRVEILAMEARPGSGSQLPAYEDVSEFTRLERFDIDSDQSNRLITISADLSAYAGKDIFVAFRHFASSGSPEAFDFVVFKTARVFHGTVKASQDGYYAPPAVEVSAASPVQVAWALLALLVAVALL